MANDLFVVELNRSDGASVFLYPQKVVEIALLVERLITSTRVSRQPELETVALIAGVKQGSLLLAYKIFMARPGVRERSDMIEHTLMAADVLSYAWTAIAFVGTHVGLLTAVPPALPYTQELSVPIADHTTAQIDACIQGFVKVAMEAECDSCTLHIPDVGAYRMDFSNIRSKAVLGRLAPKIDLPKLRGNLELVLENETLKGVWKRSNGQNDPVELLVGTLGVGVDYIPVLVKWNSKRPIPQPRASPSHVVGKLHPIQDTVFEPSEPVSPDIQRIPALLIVDGLYAAE
ncbi:hypothetical protein OVY48_09820 [Sphingobium sp. SA2]|uniref:hypothetical protein n=1 Tax=Sphingobium sp. SA2 TaxID=1524832 RepID=UPI0028C15B87|nr:hypothetical protein [Sphingobium sp. SA2]MDT7533720.1 hypothetical protein [Sphingobium sp. SA2]